MKKRVFIIHGWHGTPNKNWFQWLKVELETRGFEVVLPQLPDTNNPRITKWVSAIDKAVTKPDEQTYFVGHSLACQAIVRYLETLPSDIKVGGAVFFAGFFKRLTNIEDSVTEHHWLDAPLDLNKVKQHLPKSVALFSDNDPWVPVDNKDDFKNKLGSKIIVKSKMDHFNWRDDADRLQIVLDAVLKIAA